MRKVILFLDFDGVLHPFFPRADYSDEDNQLFSFLPRLEAILRDFSAVEIVISSSWRESRDLAELARYFSTDLQARIVGVTPVLREKARYIEVIGYLEASGLAHAKWLALDDDPQNFPVGCANVLICEDGFHEREERLLRDLLTGER